MDENLTTKADSSYQEALDSTLVVRHDAPDLVLARGADRIDLLHRMSTNSMSDLEVGQARLTVLTNALGRIIDAITVVHGENASALLASPGRGQSVADWLGSYIFFNDDVQLEQPEAQPSLWGLYGPQADAELESADGLWDTWTTDSAERLQATWRVDRPEGYRLLLGPELTPLAEDAWLPAAGTEQARTAFEALRIELGLPRFGQEFDSEITPLEVGLRTAVDFDKGCYIGQEVIARMESRDRMPRRLYGVELDGPAQAGDELQAADRSVGRLTSVVESPAQGWIGLALIDSRTRPEDGSVAVAGRPTQGTLRELPPT